MGTKPYDAGSRIVVSEFIPIAFGNVTQFQWSISTISHATTGEINYQAIAQGAFELWSVEVFDAAGQKLNRYVDYEWYELSGPTAEPILVASSQEAAVPLRLNTAVEGIDLVLQWPSTRPGDLYQVNYLTGSEWQPVTQDKTLDFDSWVVRVPMNQPRMFFRLKAEADAP